MSGTPDSMAIHRSKCRACGGNLKIRSNCDRYGRQMYNCSKCKTPTDAMGRGPEERNATELTEEDTVKLKAYVDSKCPLSPCKFATRDMASRACLHMRAKISGEKWLKRAWTRSDFHVEVSRCKNRECRNFNQYYTSKLSLDHIDGITFYTKEELRLWEETHQM
jgi:hypothetical protein